MLGSCLFLIAAISAIILFTRYNEDRVAYTLSVTIQREKEKERECEEEEEEERPNIENQPLLLN